jgi:uncharacterized phage-associated protein
VTQGPPYDPRAVANWLLDIAEMDGISVRPLALQKLLYLAHGFCLIRLGKPLMKGHFEAWQYGPVQPAVYQAFKEVGDQPITVRAVARDIMTGLEKLLPTPSDPDARQEVQYVVRSLGRLPAGRLVDLTHAPGGPWHFTVNKAKTSMALGLRITDDVTIQRFKYQKVSVEPSARAGEPDEDAPLVGNRPGEILHVSGNTKARPRTRRV